VWLLWVARIASEVVFIWVWLVARAGGEVLVVGFERGRSGDDCGTWIVDVFGSCSSFSDWLSSSADSSSSSDRDSLLD